MPGFGVDGTSCSACLDPNCVLCDNDVTQCAGCAIGYGLASGVCVPCADSNCVLCNDPNICT